MNTREVGFNWHKLSCVRLPWSVHSVLFSEARHYNIDKIVLRTVRSIHKTW